MAQLPLSWPAPTHFRFERFDVGEAAAGTVALLERRADGLDRTAPILLIAPGGSGKTHLLVATAMRAREAGRNAAYLALSRWSDFDGDALAVLAQSDLLAIDEIEAVAGRRDREIALFDLFNRCVDAGTQLVLASREGPQALPLVLPDLRSRLASATVVLLPTLDEAGRRRLLRNHANARGFELEDAVIDYLFKRHRRDLPALIALVDRLDRESLAKQRRVTIPLVRSVLDGIDG